MKVILSSFSPDHNQNPATLVFGTIRVGFPTATIECHWTGKSATVEETVRLLCKKNDINFIREAPLVTNDIIGERAIMEERGDTLVLLDSDVVFWDKIPHLSAELLYGRLIPKHICQYTGLVTQERLHPSLLIVNDIQTIRRRLYKSKSRFVPVNFFRPTVVSENGKLIFYDSFTNLYQFIGGKGFNQTMLNRYDHLFCSSFVEDVSQAPAFKNLKELHEAIYNNPQILKGRWKEQQDYFIKHSVS